MNESFINDFNITECKNIKCDKLLDCPHDSFFYLVKNDKECCKQTCQCDFDKCENDIINCDLDYFPFLVSPGTNLPGSCCDKFECRPLKNHCKDFQCTDSSVDNLESCPEDSYRPIPYVPDKSCCLSVQECRCRKTKYSSKIEQCPLHHKLVFDQKGINQPGHCNDIFHCEIIENTLKHKSSSIDNVSSTAKQNLEINKFYKERILKIGNLKALMKPSNMSFNSNFKDYQTISVCTNDDGRLFNEGETWYMNPCQICFCSKGVSFCKNTECPKIPNRCSWVDIPENECCPICLGCTDDTDKHFEVGKSWQKDDCTNCTCEKDFRWSCQKFFCKTDCDNPRKVEGQCCPECNEPLIVRTPILCPSLKACVLRCKFGLFKNKWGCIECKCANLNINYNLFEFQNNENQIEEGYSNDDYIILAQENDTNKFNQKLFDLYLIDKATNNNNNKSCIILSAENCNKLCVYGYSRNNDGCVVCECANCPLFENCNKHCLYGFEIDSVGCQICKCKVLAKNLIENNKTDLSQFESFVKNNLKHESCFTISDFDTTLIERNSGEWWTDKHCRQCFCQHGIEFCSVILCSNKSDSCPNGKWIRNHDDCCPTCVTELNNNNETDISINTVKNESRLVCFNPGSSRLYVDGETWQLTKCIACTCRMGHILCAKTQCPLLNCAQMINNTEISNNECCLSCSNNGSTSTNKSVYANNNDVYIHQFQNNSNNLITQNESEIFCTDEMDLKHAVGSSWKFDECTSCVCESDGTTKCFTETCDSIEKCEQFILIKGSCCPICSHVLTNGVVCEHNGNKYALNEEFYEGLCRNCSCCSGGHIECIETKCPIGCIDPVVVPGQCCPSCRGFDLYLFADNNSQYISEQNQKNIFFKSFPSINSSANTNSMMFYASALFFGFFFMILSIILLLFVWKCMQDKIIQKNQKKKKRNSKQNNLPILRQDGHFEHCCLVNCSEGKLNSILISSDQSQRFKSKSETLVSPSQQKLCNENLKFENSLAFNLSVASTYCPASNAASRTTIFLESDEEQS